MKIVSICSVYPNPLEPGLGLFVRSRLLHMAKTASLAIVAPVPFVDYSNRRKRWFENLQLPRRRDDEGVEVRHPRWLFPPGGTPINVICLALRLWGTLIALRRRFSFELIDAHFGYPEGVAAAILAKIFHCPFTITLRGSERRFDTYRYRRVCLRWAMRRADAIFAVSEELRQFAIERGADPARVRTIPNGIDAAVFHPRDREACRKRFGMRPDRVTVACAGELIEAKGHHLVIEAIRDLVAEGHAVDLYIAGGLARGGTPYDHEIKRRIKTWNLDERVHLTGWLDREGLAELLSAADVFCLASFSEGWPNVINEALACGTPVVATRVGAAADMVPNEQFGFLVPPRQTAPLTTALLNGILTKWDRGAIAAWGQSRSWEDVARDVMEVMHCLSKGQKPASSPAGLQVTSTRNES